jgi:uncharacterized protein
MRFSHLRPDATILFAEAPILLTAGFLAGVMNAVAGGGTFLSFPALVFIGLPSVAANQTRTIAVFPSQVASFWAHWKILAAEKRTRLPGRTSSAAFDRLVPWRLLVATLLFAFGRNVREHLSWRLVAATGGEIRWTPLLKAAALQFVIGLYGGFTGRGPALKRGGVRGRRVRQGRRIALRGLGGGGFSVLWSVGPPFLQAS